MKTLSLAGLLTACLLMADDQTKQKVQVTNTQRLDFPAGGTLRLKNSIGALTVQGWDQPEVEITTIKSTKREYAGEEREKAARELEQVRVATQRQGNELIITTDFPRYYAFPAPPPFASQRSFNLEYRIRAPRNTRLVVTLHIGEINIEDLTSDIDAKLHQGEILLLLPEDGVYAIHAKSDIGHVNSDFPETQNRLPWIFGHRAIAAAQPPSRTLNLRVGYGDIIIFKNRVPKTPAPLTSELTPNGH